jgi:hypothetical protein
VTPVREFNAEDVRSALKIPKRDSSGGQSFVGERYHALLSGWLPQPPSLVLPAGLDLKRREYPGDVPLTSCHRDDNSVNGRVAT